MCTSISYKTDDHYFGRNLDLEYSYHETVTVTPRNYAFEFRHEQAMKTHYAMIGMAYVVGGYPLYYEAANEKGLAVAGLNFPESAEYKEVKEGKKNIASFEFIPWILGRCTSIEEVRAELTDMSIVNTAFAEELPPASLHWMISDRNESIVVECMSDEKGGLRIYDDPVGVLTNEPPFEHQLLRLSDYQFVSAEAGKSKFAGKTEGVEFNRYSQGMGGIGLPGDLSSGSRFVRAAFVRCNSVANFDEKESVSQFFHILSSVSQQRGCNSLGTNPRTGNELYEITVYSSCINTDKGIYYYKTYGNGRICAVDMYREDLDGDKVVSYELNKSEDIKWQN